MRKKFTLMTIICTGLLFCGCATIQDPTTKAISQEKQNPVKWMTPTPIQSLEFFSRSEDPDRELSFAENHTKYYQAGIIQTGKYANAPIYLVIAEPEYPNYFPLTLRLIQYENKLFLIKKFSDEIDPKEILNKDVVFETPQELDQLLNDGLSAPEKITVPKEIVGNSTNEYSLKLVNKTPVFFDSKNLQPVFSLSDGKQVWMEKNTNNVWNDNDNSIFKSNGFYLPLADNTIALYKLELPFIDENWVLQITWNDGSKNSDLYEVSEGSGCGIRAGTYANIIKDKLEFEAMDPQIDILTFPFSKNDLTEIGKTSTGESILTFKDMNTPFAIDFYKKSYSESFKSVNDGIVVPLDEFINGKPFLFWVDPFGRINLYINSNFYMIAACGAKPVIYLYPKTKQEITVKVNSSKKEFVSIPKADNGWNVIADTESNIWDITSGKKFHYLFWEDSIAYEKPKTGFIVKAKNVNKFLDEKLVKMGLNNKEIADFKDFWLPKMKAYPYYFISFLQTEELNKIVPLKISPKPDSLIRVFMHFDGLQQPVEVQSQTLKPERRTGFAVVEWGGRLNL
jgi:hypothetical protein